MNRSEHLQWCKDRALKYVKNGQIKDGIASFMSDMTKHPETGNHIALEMMMVMLCSSQLKTADETSKFIQGFN